MNNSNNTVALQAISGHSLMTMNIQPIRYCIENILPQGIAMLSGSPKTGKSWLVLEWCIRIAAGEPVWNFNTTKGTTLYLCLEQGAVQNLRHHKGCSSKCFLCRCVPFHF